MPAAKKKDMIMKLKDTTDNHVPPGIALLINLPTSTPKHIPDRISRLGDQIFRFDILEHFFNLTKFFNK